MKADKTNYPPDKEIDSNLSDPGEDLPAVPGDDETSVDDNIFDDDHIEEDSDGGGLDQDDYL